MISKGVQIHKYIYIFYWYVSDFCTFQLIYIVKISLKKSMLSRIIIDTLSEIMLLHHRWLWLWSWHLLTKDDYHRFLSILLPVISINLKYKHILYKRSSTHIPPYISTQRCNVHDMDNVVILNLITHICNLSFIGEETKAIY
jgi:hypothetical protein